MPAPLVCVIGATASGKSALIERVARAIAPTPLEVISADSRQVYRGLDIGTAKYRGPVVHHLVDTLEPTERYSAARFAADAARAITDVHARGAIPVVVGGSGFYIRALAFGATEPPPATPELRRRLLHESERRGMAWLRAELERVDPCSARKIAPRDRYRTLRALEIYHQTGRPRSSFVTPRAPRTGVVLLGLACERAELYRRIDARVDAMFAAGLVDEVRAILAAGIPPDAPGLQTIGYRELIACGAPALDTEAARNAHRLIARNTRRYAKRQTTFFRTLPVDRWITPDDAGVEHVVTRVSAGGSLHEAIV